ncbi:hypothetical protein AOLI_G00328980, partial [Acnodon oligacanthus]
VHKVQLKYGCELHEDGPDAGFWQYRYDEDVFISFDLNTGTWMATKPIAVTIKKEWETEKRAGHVKSYLRNECAECLSNIVRYRRSTPERKGTASHSLHYFYTAVTPGINFPEFTVVGLVDGEQIDYYDSNIRKMIPKTEWMEKNEGEDYWTTQTQISQGDQETFKVGVETLMQRFNQTDGVHTWQNMYGCELHDDGTTRGYDQFGYDGDDFISLDLKTETWTAAHPKAVITKQKWEGTAWTVQDKAYLENTCIEWLQKYVGYGRSTLERKVSPKVSLFQKDSSSPVVCHATGFFPKAVMISWQKNGEDLHEDVELRETLRNQDGTFQKRSVLTVSPEELNRNQYSCVIQHSSQEKEMVLPVTERRLLSPGGGESIGLIIGAVVAVLLLVVIGCVGFFIWKKRESNAHKLESSSTSSRSSGADVAYAKEGHVAETLLQKKDGLPVDG